MDALSSSAEVQEVSIRNIPHLKPEWELLDDALRHHMLTLREGRFAVRGYGGAVDVVSMYRLTLDTAPYPPMGAGRELRWSEQKMSVARHCCV
ncbi:hypothetical protein MCOR14_008777 [Pyricularia oryzae]|nr:hypothetical protein MCOR14_008777 [Pyricularia oryzae]